MTLKAKRGLVGAGQALQRAVKQADVGGAQVGGERFLIHRETVVLAGDADAAGVQVFNGVIGPVVAELHLESFGTTGQGHDLVTQADAEGGDAGFDQFARGGNSVITGLGVAWSVGQKEAVGFEFEYLGSRGLRGHDGDLAAALGQHAQDVFLDAKVVGHHMKLRRGLCAEAGFAVGIEQHPLGLCPGVRLLSADQFGQVQATHVRRTLGQGNGLVDARLGDGFAGGQANDGAVLRAFGAQQAGELAGVDVGDGDSFLIDQVLRQCLGEAKVAGQLGQIFDDQACGMDFVGFDVLRVDAVVADVRVREGHDLLAIAGVGEDFLVAGHGGVEHHLTGGGACGSNRVAEKDCAVCKRQDGGREGSL